MDLFLRTLSYNSTVAWGATVSSRKYENIVTLREGASKGRQNLTSPQREQGFIFPCSRCGLVSTPKAEPDMSHPLRVKICGVTNEADARQAALLGADAVGLNFYHGSPRCIDS